jgi:hypothetical protein
MPDPDKSPRKKDQLPIKRSAEWHEQSRREAVGALKRARERDARWRGRCDEARRRDDDARAWFGAKS